jgi:hypothetical protein
LISNVLQAQTQVTLGQPVLIGGGGASNPKANTLIGAMITPSTCLAGSTFNVTFNVNNPNNYTVMGTLYINFSCTSLISSSTVYVCSSNPAILLYTLQSTSTATNSTLFHVFPDSASHEFVMPPGITDNLVNLAVQLNTPGNYTWTVWMGV